MYLGKLSDRQTSFQLVRAHTCEKQIVKRVYTGQNSPETRRLYRMTFRTRETPYGTTDDVLAKFRTRFGVSSGFGYWYDA